MILNIKFLSYYRVSKIVLGLALALTACGSDPKKAEDAEVSFRIAKQFYMKNEFTQALGNALKARDQDPANAEIHNFLGLIYFQKKSYDEAEKSFRKAVKVDPKYSEAHNHLCMLLTEKNRYDDAILSCQKAVGNILYSTPERAYHNMGVAYEKKGDTAKALDSYRRATELNKRFVMSLKAYGRLLSNERKYFDALGPLEGAAQVCNESPKGIWQYECPDAHFHLALVYIQLQKRDKALTSLEDCIKSSDIKNEIINKCQTSLKAYK